MILRVATFALLLSFANLATASAARIIYTYADTSVEKTPIALLSQEPPDTDSMCRHRIADVVVSGISYNESSGMIDGFSALSTGKGVSKKYWNLFTIGMDARQMVDLSRLLQTRTNLIVLYTVCGARDFHYARELWIKNAVNIP